MARRRHHSKFDDIFRTATERAVTLLEAGVPRGGDAIIQLNLRSNGIGRNVSMQLRQYWASLGESLKAGEISSLDPLARLAAAAEMLATTHPNKQYHIVEIVHRGQLSTAKALAEGLGLMKDQLEALPQPPPPPAVEPGIVDAIRRAVDVAAGKPSAQDSLMDALYPGKPAAEGTA